MLSSRPSRVPAREKVQICCNHGHHHCACNGGDGAPAHGLSWPFRPCSSLGRGMTALLPGCTQSKHTHLGGTQRRCCMPVRVVGQSQLAEGLLDVVGAGLRAQAQRLVVIMHSRGDKHFTKPLRKGLRNKTRGQQQPWLNWCERVVHTNPSTQIT